MAALLVSAVVHGFLWQVFRLRQPVGHPLQAGATTQLRIVQMGVPAPESVLRTVAPALSTRPQTQASVQDDPHPLAEPPASDASTGTSSGLGSAATGAYYFPPDQLSAKPVFLNDEGAPSATFIPDVMPLPVRVQVFINERGEVDLVVLSDNFLSDVARNLIDASFRAMHFSPGMLGALPVKSQLGFEVKLDPTLPSQ